MDTAFLMHDMTISIQPKFTHFIKCYLVMEMMMKYVQRSD